MSECGQESSLKTRAEQENKQRGNLSSMHEKKQSLEGLQRRNVFGSDPEVSSSVFMTQRFRSS